MSATKTRRNQFDEHHVFSAGKWRKAYDVPQFRDLFPPLFPINPTHEIKITECACGCARVQSRRVKNGVPRGDKTIYIFKGQQSIRIPHCILVPDRID